MNIFELLSFDFGEFVTSTPGILIIIGIVLLVVGIVLFFMEGKKNKNSEIVEEKKDTPIVTPEVSSQSLDTPAPVVETPVAPAVETPALSATEPLVVPSEGDGVKEVEAPKLAESINFNENVKEVAPVVEAPVVEKPAAPVVEAPVVETPVAPVVESPVVEEPTTPVVETPVTVLPETTVYGGANPEAINTEVLDEKPREIYGGANPLENTSPIPAVTVNEAYHGEQVTTPAIEAIAQSAVEVAPVVETPVAPVVETPVTPVVETPAVETPVTSEVTVPVAPVAEVAVSQPEVKEEIEKLEF